MSDDLNNLTSADLRDLLERSAIAHRIESSRRDERRRAAREQHPFLVPVKQAMCTAAFFIAHALLAALAIALLSGISWLLHWLGSPRLFDRVPVSYIFDAMDLMILVVFGVFGTMEAVAVFRE